MIGSYEFGEFRVDSYGRAMRRRTKYVGEEVRVITKLGHINKRGDFVCHSVKRDVLTRQEAAES